MKSLITLKVESGAKRGFSKLNSYGRNSEGSLNRKTKPAVLCSALDGYRFLCVFIDVC